MDVGGAPYAPRSPRDARDRGIALIHQELSLFPHLTVAENVLMGAGALAPRALGPRRGAPPHAGRAGRVRPPRDRPRRAGRAPAHRRAAGRRDLPRDRGAGPGRAHGRADEQPAARRRGPALRDDRPAVGRGCRRRLHQPLPGGDAGGGVGLHRPARRPHGRDGHARLRHQRRAHRPHGGPHRGRALPPPRGPAVRRRRARGGRPRRPRAARGLVHPPPGRGPRRLRPHGLGADGDGAGPLRPRPPGGRPRGRRAGASAASTPRRRGGSRTASATSARTARARGSPSPSPWPTTSP